MVDTLFDLGGVDSASSFPARLRDMHAARGIDLAGRTCGACAHLATVKMGGVYFKCGLSRVTAGPGSDWRKGWPACGAFVAGEQVTVFKG